MVSLAVIVLAVAVALGLALALIWLKRDRTPPRLAWTHGAVALAGLALFVPSLLGPVRGAANGTAAFGMVTAALLGAGAVAGLALLTLRLKARRFPGVLVGIHAMLAISGFVILAVYALLG